MPDVPPHDALLEELRALVAALREANARLREAIKPRTRNWLRRRRRWAC